MPEDFKIQVEADLDTSKAEKKLADLTKDKKTIKLDIDINNQNLNNLQKNIEKGIKNTKIDTSAITKQIADSFNITDKSVLKNLTKQLNNMVSSLGKTWNGSKFDFSKASGFYSGIDSISKQIVENGKIVKSATGYYDDFYNYFRNKKIYVSDDLKKALGGDTYKELLQNNIGKITKDSKKGIAIDSIWGEMSNLFPEHFSQNITNQADQIIHTFNLVKKARQEMTQVINASDMTGKQKFGMTDSAYSYVIDIAKSSQGDEDILRFFTVVSSIFAIQENQPVCPGKDIYSLYLQGIGKARIGRILGERGILIPTLYKREVQGMRFNNPNALETTKVWSFQTIHQILNNEVYIGNLIQNRRSTLSYKDKKTKALPPEKWIKVENAHEPIISKDIFERVKALQKIKTKSVNAKNPKYESIFSGLIFCADCKHSMVRKYKRRGNREFVGYVCSTYKTHGNSVCTSHSVDYEELTDAVLLSIQREARKILSGEDVEELKKISCRNRRIENIEKEIEFAEKRKEKINNFKQKTYQSYIEELISKEDYVKYSANYDKELKELNGEIAELEKHREDDKELELEYQEWVNKFSEYVNIDKLTRGIVLELIERIDVSEDGCICIHYRFKNPYEE